MTSILQSLSKTVHLSLGIAILLFLGLHFFGEGFAFDTLFWSWLFRFIHVVVAIWNNRMKAIKVCVNRFDDETKQSFIELYDKIDADVNVNGEENGETV